MGDTTGGVSDPAVVAARGEANPEPDINRRFFSAGFIQQHPNRAFLYNQIRLLNPERPVNLPVSGSIQSGHTASDLGRLASVPTLLIVGEEDPISPVPAMQALQRLIPNSRLEIVPEAAHSAYFEQPAAFNNLVGEFFEQVLSSMVGAQADN